MNKVLLLLQFEEAPESDGEEGDADAAHLTYYGSGYYGSG